MLIKEGPETQKEGPGSTSTPLFVVSKSHHIETYLVSSARRIWDQMFVIKEGQETQKEGPDSTSIPLFVVSKSHHIETYLVGSARRIWDQLFVSDAN